MLALALFSPLLVAPAEAGPVFTEASAEVYLDDNGNWPRAYPYNDGWMVFHAGGGDYQLTHAHADLSPDRTDDRALTGRTDLKDHDVRPCPDGTFLHVATADFVPQGHDSAYSWRYDADAHLISNGTIAEADTSGSVYVDMPGVCGNHFQGALFEYPPSSPGRFVEIGPDGSPGALHDMEGSPASNGSSLLEDLDGTLWISGSPPHGPWTDFSFVHYDTAFNLLGSVEVPVVDAGQTAIQPQTTIRVGNTYIVAYLYSAYSESKVLDLALAAFDQDWNLIDNIQLSENSGTVGGMTPYVVYDGHGSLLALYAKDLQNYAFTVTLDPSVYDVVVDTGTPPDTSTDSPSDSESGSDTWVDAKPGCGCATSTPGGPMLALMIAGAAATACRRRDLAG